MDKLTKQASIQENVATVIPTVTTVIPSTLAKKLAPQFHWPLNYLQQHHLLQQQG